MKRASVEERLSGVGGIDSIDDVNDKDDIDQVLDTVEFESEAERERFIITLVSNAEDVGQNEVRTDEGWKEVEPVIYPLDVFWRDPGLILACAPIGLIVWIVTMGLSAGVFSLVARDYISIFLAIAIAMMGAYGSTRAVIRDEGSIPSGYLKGLLNGNVKAPIGTMVTLVGYLVGSMVLITLLGAFGFYNIFAGAIGFVFIAMGARIATAVLFIDVRIATGDAGLDDAITWNIRAANKKIIGFFPVIGRLPVLAVWLWFPYDWVTSSGYPGHLEAVLFLVASVFVATVLVVWHVETYERARSYSDNVEPPAVGRKHKSAQGN